MKTLYEKIATLIRQGQNGVVMTLVAAEEGGSREPGAKMLLAADGTVTGTIGGGRLELFMLEQAREVLRLGRARLVTWVDPQTDERHRCGGRVQVFLEPITSGPGLFVVGFGHVGGALARLAGHCGWQVTVLDDRLYEDDRKECYIRIGSYEDPFAGLAVTSASAIVICSRSHATDLESLRAALATDAGFIGLLGSRKKRAAFFQALRDEGVDERQLQRVQSPVGLDIGARTPEEIAVSIMASLIRFQNGG